MYLTWEFTIQDKTVKGQTKSYKGGINPDIFEQFRVDIGDRYDVLSTSLLFNDRPRDNCCLVIIDPIIIDHCTVISDYYQAYH